MIHVASVLYSKSFDAIKRPKLALFCCTLRYSTVLKRFLLCIMWCCCESSVLLCKRVVLIFMRVEVCLGEVIYGAVVLLVRLFRVKCVSCRSDRHRHICLRTHTVFPDLPKTENKMPPKSNSAEQINRGRGTRPNPAAYKIRQKKKQTFLKRHQTSL